MQRPIDTEAYGALVKPGLESAYHHQCAHSIRIASLPELLEPGLYGNRG